MAAPDLKTLGRYALHRVLGKGAMGVVYEGFDPKLNRRVAIKTILRRHLDESTARNFAQRFVQEAHAVARLNHPHIVQVHDFGEEGEVSYLVMEFIRGKELKSFFDANERFDTKEAVRIMGELLDALEFAHQAGVVHRDVKPGNVMLDSQARTKLTDFGVARLQDASRSHATQEGTMVGTPAYMSPEQIGGVRVDARTDVFSAGIILYQFLTGVLPFSGGGPWTVAKKIMQDDPPAVSSLNPALTPFFDVVVNRALAKDPAERYPSARAFGEALKLALDGKGELGDADRTVAGGASLATQRPAPRRDAAKAEAAAGRTPSRFVPAAIALLLVALVGGGYYLYSRDDAQSQRRLAEMQSQLESAKRQAAELEKARQREADARVALEKARITEEEAKKSADLARQKQLAEERLRAEAKLRETAAVARAVQEKALAAERARAEKTAAEARTAAEKAAAQKLTAQKAAGDKPAAKEAAVAASAAASRLPQVGDTWTYRLTEPESAGSPARAYTILVAASSGTSIVDQFSLEGGDSGHSSHDRGRYLVSVGRSVFSPYFVAFDGSASPGRLGAVQVREEDCKARYQCEAEGRIVGSEIIEVAAGTFETIKLVVDLKWRPQVFRLNAAPPGWFGMRRMTVWYSAAAKRAVKFSSRGTVDAPGRGFEPLPNADFDLELVSFRLQ